MHLVWQRSCIAQVATERPMNTRSDPNAPSRTTSAFDPGSKSKTEIVGVKARSALNYWSFRICSAAAIDEDNPSWITFVDEKLARVDFGALQNYE